MILKKCPFFFCLLLIALSIQHSFSQEKVQINFCKYSPGDIDLMIRDVLVKNGYDARINYGNDTISFMPDYVIDYTAISRENYDELHKFSLILSKDGQVINEINKTILYVNFGVSAPRVLYKGLEKLFKKKFNANQFTNENEVKNFNIFFRVNKIDDGKYIIVAKGAAIRTLEAVKEAFFKKAGQYLSSYDYFIEEYKYHDPTMSGHVYIGYLVRGIIIQNSGADEIIPLGIKPAEFEEIEYPAFFRLNSLSLQR